MRLPVNTVIHTTLVGLEPATFRSLVRRATSSATEPTDYAYPRIIFSHIHSCKAALYFMKVDQDPEIPILEV